MTISRLTRATKEALSDVNGLLAQLRSEDSRGSMADLRRIAADKTCVMLLMKDGRKIVGIATMYFVQKVGYCDALVEDVVIDGAYRGQGLGERIMQEAIRLARRKKVRTIRLTSRPSRIAANKLYQKLGFERNETNVYRLRLK